jgi:predicted nucleic acid-binding protein
LGIERLRNFLRNHRIIGLDTSVFLYQVEGHARYVALSDEIFQWLAEPGHRAVTSTLTMMELLVHPHREGLEQQIHQFFALLTTCPNLSWIAPDLTIADMAARVRGHHRLLPPDAIQAATAVHCGATGFITNYYVFERFDAFETLVLDHILTPSGQRQA